MKRIGAKAVALLLVAALFLCTGCSHTPAKSEIIGLWECTDAQKMLDGFLGILGQVGGFSIPTGLVDVNFSLEFREDNTFEVTGSIGAFFYVEDIDPIEGTYSYANGTLSIDGEKVDGFRIKGNTLTIDVKDSDGRKLRIPFEKQNG